MATDLGIDLGTGSVKIFTPKDGIVLNESSMVIASKTDGTTAAIGEEASEMIGRTPEGVLAIRPIRNGVITNFNYTVDMLKYFIKKVSRNPFLKARAVISIPSGVTEVQRRAVEEAAHGAGIREVILVEEPLAAAIGAGMPVNEPRGSMVVDIGAGISEAAVVSLNGIVVSNAIRIAGDAFDAAIVQYVKKKYNMTIGEITAEQLKIKIGEDVGKVENRHQLNGCDMVSGLPKTVTIRTGEVRDAISECVGEIVDLVKLTLEQTPPELAADIMESGIVLTGGGALLSGLGKVISIETGITVYIAESPLECVAIGAGSMLEKLNENKKFKFEF